MLLFVTVIHFIVAVLLIVMVLIQDSKGGGVFGMSGAGGSNQVFSATGAANFLVKLTRALAVIFAGTCITLTYLTSTKSTSVVDDYVPAATAPTGMDASEAATGNVAPTGGNPEATPAEKK